MNLKNIEYRFSHILQIEVYKNDFEYNTIGLLNYSKKIPKYFTHLQWRYHNCEVN